MSLYDKSSLVLIPSGTKTGKVYSQVPVSGDGDFTFTRSSAATRVNADGFIEKETSNLMLQSNAFNNWSGDPTLTSGQTGYDGSSDAWLLDATSVNQFIYRNDVTSFSGVTTISVYAKKGTADGIRLRFNQSSDANIYINLINGSDVGAASGTISHNVTNLGSGWYRIEMSFIASGSQDFRIYPTDVTGTSVVGSIYIQDVQAEQGLVARDYIETTTTAVEGGITDNVPRLDYTDSSCPALLLEPQRTNLINHSEYGAGASLSNMTATSNAATSPEGVSNATTMQTGITGQCQVYQSFNASTGNHTGSVFLKKVDFDWVYMEVGGAVAWFNIGNGTLGNGSAYGGSWTYVDHTIEDYGNGWYRCTLTGNCVSAGGYTFRSLQPVSNNGGYFSNLAGGDTHWFGTQVEAGSYETSYIPTYGSSVTRVSDSVINSSASDLIGQTEGTILFDWNYLSNDGDFDFRFNLSDGASITEWLFVGMTNADARAYITSGGSVQFDSEDEYAITIGNRYKMALAYANNDFAFYINGTQVATSSGGSVPTGMDYIVMSNRPNSSGSVVKESVNQALLFKSRLTNEELAALTTI